MTSEFTSPTLTCRSCLLNFNSPKQVSSKAHLLNNHPFCHHCRETYRSLWQSINLKCQKDLKGAYDKSKQQHGGPHGQGKRHSPAGKSDPKNIKNTQSTIQAKNYASILIKYIQATQKCPNNYKVSDLSQKCIYTFVWQEKCEWCLFKKMTPLIGKIPIFRYSTEGFKPYFMLWKEFFSVNSLICSRVVEYFKNLDSGSQLDRDHRNAGAGCDLDDQTDTDSDLTNIDRNHDRDQEICVEEMSVDESWKQYNLQKDIQDIDNVNKISKEFKTRYNKKEINTYGINHTNIEKIEIMYKNDAHMKSLRKLYSAFNQINQDQLNSSFYLEGMFENPSYIFNKFGRELTQLSSKELVSIETPKNLAPGLTQNSFLGFWDSQHVTNMEVVGDFEDFGRHALQSSCSNTSTTTTTNTCWSRKKINNYHPLKISVHVHKFAQILINTVSMDGLERAGNKTQEILQNVGGVERIIVTPGIQVISWAISKLNSIQYRNIFGSEFLYKNVLNSLQIINVVGNTTLQLQFLWNFDHQTGRFYLNEHAHFSFETLKTKIKFYHNSKGLEQREAENFILQLYTVAKTLSMRPKFQLILISLAFAGHTMLCCTRPIFHEQCQVSGYYTKSEIESLNIKLHIYNRCLNLYTELLNTFELTEIFSILKDLIPKAIQMELFLLSNVSKQAIFKDVAWKENLM